MTADGYTSPPLGFGGDAGLRQRIAALTVERDALARRLDEMTGFRDATQVEYDEMRAERDVLRTALAVVGAQRDEARAERDRMRSVVEAAVATVDDMWPGPNSALVAAVDAYRSVVAQDGTARPSQEAQDGPGAAGGTAGHPGPPVATVDTGIAPTDCPRSRRLDGLHSTRWDGDDPRTICVFCGEIRDALSGEVLGHQPVDGGA